MANKLVTLEQIHAEAWAIVMQQTGCRSLTELNDKLVAQENASVARFAATAFVDNPDGTISIKRPERLSYRAGQTEQSTGE